MTSETMIIFESLNDEVLWEVCELDEVWEVEGDPIESLQGRNHLGWDNLNTTFVYHLSVWRLRH